MIRIGLLFALASLAACADAPPLAGDWTVNSAESRVSFVSVKAGEIAEVHHFTEFGGGVSADGVAQVTIELASVETLIDIRNERMREFLFEVARFPRATVTAQFDTMRLQDLGVGDRITFPLPARLELHGEDVGIEPNVYVTRIATDRVAVETVDPFVIYANDFNFGDGLARLQELASLPSITSQAPVSFSIVFEQE